MTVQTNMGIALIVLTLKQEIKFITDMVIKEPHN